VSAELGARSQAERPSTTGPFLFPELEGNGLGRVEVSPVSSYEEDRVKAFGLVSFDVPAGVIDVPEPFAGPGEVLVRVSASSLNNFDVGVAAGTMRDYLPYEFPAVIGNDLAGSVEAVGEGVEGFAVGQRVFGMMGMKGGVHDGSFAQLANPQAGSIVLAPDDLSYVDGGTLGVAGTTAMSGVVAVEPSEGARVLVVGATGGVGTFAIQLAALRGAHVIASVRPGDEEFVTGLGAAETIDYTGDVLATLRERYPGGIDAVIEAVSRGHDAFVALAGAVRSGGRATSVVGGAGELSKVGDVSVSNAGADGTHLVPLADLVVQGKLRVAIRRSYPLDGVAQALSDFRDQHTLGKLVITVA
jgi:NADPH2:quinone reductase